MFRALVVEKAEDGTTQASVQELEDDRLPEGDVTVAVEYSTVNYKDGLCLGSGGGLVKHYPHVPGVDFAGTVEASGDARYKPGDRVVLTGWRVGEIHWGGYAQKARVKADWLVPLPEGLTTRQAMAVGTAGFTAMLAAMAPDSVMCPYEKRIEAWRRIGADLPMDKLEAMVQSATLGDLPGLGGAILGGSVKRRVVVNVNA